MRRRRVLAVLLAIVLAFAVAVYACALSVYTAGRDLYLLAIGMRHGEVRVGGHRIHYLTGGDGPPLVVVHGVASRAADAAPLYRRLMQQHRVYALDLLGYGESDKPRNASYSVAQQSDIVRGFMEAVSVAEADVIGISLGGWIALKVAAEHPERVRRLVLVSSAGLQFPTTLRETSFSAANLDELRASLTLQTDNAKYAPGFVLRDFLRHSKERAWIVRRSMREALSGRDLLDRKLQKVRMPVLLVWGTNDRIIPFTVAASMQRELPHAKLIALRGCGHLAIVECREEALPRILEFLRGTRGTRRNRAAARRYILRTTATPANARASAISIHSDSVGIAATVLMATRTVVLVALFAAAGSA